MLKIRFSLFLLCCSMLMYSAEAIAQCNLPAPTNLSVTYPNNSTAQLTWTPVPSAWGYEVDIVNNVTNQTETIVTNTTNASFTGNPNTSYTITVASMCSSTSTSTQTTGTSADFTDWIITTEILVEYQGGSSNEYIFVASGPLTANQTYVTESWAIPADGEIYVFSFKYLNNTTIYGNFIRNQETSDNVLISKNPVHAGWGLRGETQVGTGRYQQMWLTTLQFGSRHGLIFNFGNSNGRLEFTPVGSNISDFIIYKLPASALPPIDRSDDTSPATTRSDSSVKLSPNPCTDQLIVQGDANTEAAPYQIKVMNVAGQVIHETQLDYTQQLQTGYSIHTAAWAPGLYWVQVRDVQGHISVQKVIKQP
jgi:Secretion system C-terminal sorting domain